MERQSSGGLELWPVPFQFVQRPDPPVTFTVTLVSTPSSHQTFPGPLTLSQAGATAANMGASDMAGEIAASLDDDDELMTNPPSGGNVVGPNGQQYFVAGFTEIRLQTAARSGRPTWNDIMALADSGRNSVLGRINFVNALNNGITSYISQNIRSATFEIWAYRSQGTDTPTPYLLARGSYSCHLTVNQLP